MTNWPWTRGEVGIRKCDIDCGEQELRSESKIFAEYFVEENGFGVEGCKYYARVRTLPRRDGLGTPSLEAKEIFNSLKPSNMYILIIDGLIRSHLYNNIMILCINEQALWRRLQKNIQHVTEHCWKWWIDWIMWCGVMWVNQDCLFHDKIWSSRNFSNEMIWLGLAVIQRAFHAFI